MSEETSREPGAVEEERELREHEREARARTDEERDRDADRLPSEEGDAPIPPANAQRGSLSQ